MDHRGGSETPTSDERRSSLRREREKETTHNGNGNTGHSITNITPTKNGRLANNSACLSNVIFPLLSDVRKWHQNCLILPYANNNIFLLFLLFFFSCSVNTTTHQKHRQPLTLWIWDQHSNTPNAVIPVWVTCLSKKLFTNWYPVSRRPESIRLWIRSLGKEEINFFFK